MAGAVHPRPDDGRVAAGIDRLAVDYSKDLPVGVRELAGIAARLVGEPGFAARCALEEYIKWEASVRAKLKNAAAVAAKNLSSCF